MFQNRTHSKEPPRTALGEEVFNKLRRSKCVIKNSNVLPQEELFDLIKKLKIWKEVIYLKCVSIDIRVPIIGIGHSFLMIYNQIIDVETEWRIRLLVQILEENIKKRKISSDSWSYATSINS